jgi:hypothetical protein
MAVSELSLKTAEKFKVETGDGLMGAAKIRREMDDQTTAPLSSAEERGPIGSAFLSTEENDSCSPSTANSTLG